MIVDTIFPTVLTAIAQSGFRPKSIKCDKIKSMIHDRFGPLINQFNDLEAINRSEPVLSNLKSLDFKLRFFIFFQGHPRLPDYSGIGALLRHENMEFLHDDG